MTEIRLLSRADLDHLPRPEWLVRGLIPQHALALVYGDPGSAKSFLALDWALTLAAGLPRWHGRTVAAASRRVIYIAAEGAHGIGPRVKAWEHANADGRPADAFYLVPDPVNFYDGTGYEALEEHVRVVRPGLVVVDTLNRCTAGMDENAARDMGLLIARADILRKAYGCTVLFVHHANKEGGYRGSTALHGGVDTTVKLSKAKGGKVTVSVTKQKDAPEADDLPTLYLTDSPVGSATLTAGKVADKVAAIEAARQKLGPDATVRAVAQEAGVPRSTTSRLLNGASA